MGSIGEKNKRITIKSATLTSDSQGGSTLAYTTTRCTVWAHLGPLGGREALLAQQLTAVLSTMVTIWFRTDVSVTDRITLGSRTLQIESVADPTGLNDELVLLCSEVQA